MLTGKPLGQTSPQLSRMGHRLVPFSPEPLSPASMVDARLSGLGTCRALGQKPEQVFLSGMQMALCQTCLWLLVAFIQRFANMECFADGDNPRFDWAGRHCRCYKGH